MADNITFRDGNGATFVLRAKQYANSTYSYYVGVVTAIPTALSGSQTIALATGADATLTVPSNATHALMTVDGGQGDARYWENGTSPSSTAGWDIPAGSGAELTNLANVKIRSTSGTPSVQIGYRRYDQ